jgi:hypothetical protein
MNNGRTDARHRVRVVPDAEPTVHVAAQAWTATATGTTMGCVRRTPISCPLYFALALTSGCSESHASTTDAAAQDGGRCFVRADCPDGTVCVAGSCHGAIACSSSRVCAGLVCDVARGECVECLTRADCGPDRLSCTDGVCSNTLDATITQRDGALDAASTDAGTHAADDTGPRDAGWDATIDAPPIVLPDANIEDAAIADGSAGDAGEGPCDPATRPDLFARYVGDLGVATVAGRFVWRDQGPMGADLDGIAGASVMPGAANGHDAVVVGDMVLTPGHSAGWNPGQPFLASFVFRVETPAREAIFGKGATLASSGAHGLLVSTHAGDSAIDIQFSGDTRTVAAALTPTGSFHVLTITYDGGATVRAFVDSRLAFTVADATTSALEVLGAYVVGPFGGAIAEMVFFLAPSAASPATHHACVDAYLMGRYGIAAP